MFTKIYQFNNVPPILPILQKGRTTVEWTWWRHRNANNKICSPQSFLANSVPDENPYSKDVRECQQVSILRSQTKKRSFLRSSFQSSLLKHAGEFAFFFFVLHNADFAKFRNASELSWENVLLIRVLYKEQTMRHGSSATLTYENFVNDWYSTTNMLEVSTWEIV